MNKLNKKNIIIMAITSVVCLLPLILSIVLYKDLPDEIAVHWNSSGEVDAYAGKAFVAFLFPLIFMVLNIIAQFFLYGDPKRKAHSKAMELIAVWLVPLLSLIIIPITLLIALGNDIPIIIFVYVFVGIVFIVCGNYLPKSRRNFTIGIKIPWTLNSDYNWNKTHRMAGILWIIGGIVMILGAFLFINHTTYLLWFTLIVIAVLAIVPIAYSYILFKTHNEKDDQQ